MYPNRLQRKVILTIFLVIALPVVISGYVSANWIAGRMENSIEHWLQESSLQSRSWLARLHHNHQRFMAVLDEESPNTKSPDQGSPIPARFENLMKAFWINLVQLQQADGKPGYSSLDKPAIEGIPPADSEAIVPVLQAGRRQLAAITTFARNGQTLVLGTLFDKELLQQLDQVSGIKTRLYYPDNGDFTRAFSAEDEPNYLDLPTQALLQLRSGKGWFVKNAEQGRYYGLYTPILSATGQLEAVLFNGVVRHGSDDVLTDHDWLAMTLIAIGGLFALGVGYLLSRLVVKPVEYLHRAVIKVSTNDLRARIAIQSKDELGELAEAFNAMAEHLRQARDAERQQFQRDKLSALGEMSLAMAHEIRNPIGIINTAAQLLGKAEDLPRRNQLIAMIGEESQRLNQLLRDFQQLVRHRQPQLRPVDPMTALEAALRTTLAGREDIALERKYHHGHALILADQQLLQQAWTNLIRNALEAMGTGPGRLKLSSWLTDGKVWVALQDSGPGIPFTQRSHLFEPFFTTKQEGTGLGLPMANTLVQANGAELELLDRQTGGGACFAMVFPRLEHGECSALS